MPQIANNSRQASSKRPMKSIVWICGNTQLRSFARQALMRKGMMRPSNRGSSIAYVTSLFTQREAIAAGDRMTIIQSHRASAAPISSCHCAAPRMSCSLNQMDKPSPRRTLASLFRNFLSLTEWERKIPAISAGWTGAIVAHSPAYRRPGGKRTRQPVALLGSRFQKVKNLFRCPSCVLGLFDKWQLPQNPRISERRLRRSAALDCDDAVFEARGRHREFEGLLQVGRTARFGGDDENHRVCAIERSRPRPKPIRSRFDVAGVEPCLNSRIAEVVGNLRGEIAI